MGITDHDDNIHRDWGVLSPNVYAGDGQGCATIWFHSIPEAREAIVNNGNVIPTGKDAGLCEQCRGSCSFSDIEEWKRRDDFLCSVYKAHWSRELKAPEEVLKNVPI